MQFSIIVTNNDGYQWFAGYVVADSAAEAVQEFIRANGLPLDTVCQARKVGE